MRRRHTHSLACKRHIGFCVALVLGGIVCVCAAHMYIHEYVQFHCIYPSIYTFVSYFRIFMVHTDRKCSFSKCVPISRPQLFLLLVLCRKQHIERTQKLSNDSWSNSIEMICMRLSCSLCVSHTYFFFSFFFSLIYFIFLRLYFSVLFILLVHLASLLDEVCEIA